MSLSSQGVEISFRDGTIDEFNLTYWANQIEFSCDVSGSISGGSSTEFRYSIGAEKIADFLKALQIASTAELNGLVAGYSGNEWRELKNIVAAHATKSFMWSETNWDD
jgi:hypothetical protein